MSFSWREYLRLASELAERKSEEASIRSAVSRAYYAAFHTAANHRAARSSLPTRGGSHGSVWLALMDSNVPTWQRAGNIGHKLMKFRHEVDYRDTVPNLRFRVGDAIRWADDILRLLT